MNRPVPISLLEEWGYTNIREVDGKLCGVMRFIFTVGVCVGLHEFGYERRFCFDSYSAAQLFLKEWDGKTLPVVGVDGRKAIK